MMMKDVMRALLNASRHWAPADSDKGKAVADALIFAGEALAMYNDDEGDGFTGEQLDSLTEWLDAIAIDTRESAIKRYGRSAEF